MAADRAADAEVVGVDDRAVDLHLLALEAEVGDPVLPAAVRAAGDVDAEMLLEPGQPLLERLDEAAGESLRLGERQLAELGARAGDCPAPERRGVEHEVGGLELAHEGAGTPGRHVGDDEVLHAGGPERTGAVAVGQIGGHAQLFGSEPPPQHGNADVAGARLLLRVNPDVVAVRVVRRILGHAARQRRSEALLDGRKEPVGGPAVVQEQELQTGALAVLPEHVGVAEDLGDRADHRERARLGHERVEPNAEVGIGGEPAADPDRVADLAGRMARRGEPDVVDLGIRAPGAAARDRDFELPRQIVEGGVAVQHARRLENDRRGVDQLTGVQAGDRAAGDVAGHVPARAHRGHAPEPERAEDLGKRLEGYPVELDVLTHGDVGDAVAVPLGEVGDGPELRRFDDAVGYQDADHGVADGLALAVAADDRVYDVPLGVDATPAEVRAEPLGRDRVPTLAGEALDLGVRLPRILLALEPLDALRLRFLHGFAHRSLQKRKRPGTGAILSPSSRPVSLASSSPGRGFTSSETSQTPNPRLTSQVLGSRSAWRPRGHFYAQRYAQLHAQRENTHCRSRLSRETWNRAGAASPRGHAARPAVVVTFPSRPDDGAQEVRHGEERL